MVSAKKLLFVKLKHIGDTIVLTPTLAAARKMYPDAQIWAVVRKGCEGILEGCPAIDRVLTSAAPETTNRNNFDWLNDLKLLWEIRRQHFDYAFELTQGDRGRLLVAWSGAQFRCVSDGVYRVPRFWRRWFNRFSIHDWRTDHQVEANFYFVNEFLSLGTNTPPPLVFERAFIKPCDLSQKLANYVIIHPGTRWKRKRWTREKWIELGRWLLVQQFQIVISAGPDAEEVGFADELRSALGEQVLNTRGATDWPQLAGLLYGARLFIGMDTAAMHLAAACQCPIVAIFGPSSAAQWHPWRVPYRLVQPAFGLQTPAGEENFAANVSVPDVIQACEILLHETNGATR